MKTEKKRWRPSPALVVVTTAIVVIIGTLLIGWLSARRYRVTARVEIAGPAPHLERSISQAPAPDAFLPDGEVARMASRAREGTGLLMGLVVLAVNEQMNDRRLTDVESLINLMAQRNLFPPGVNRTAAQGALSSGRGTIYVRYRPLPLGVEVVSIGRERLDGPALIARLTAGAEDNSGALLFVARKVEGVRLPGPFAPLADVVALNWSVEALRERQFTPQEIEALNNWAQQYAGK
jgi:hypothetical protein